MRPNNVGSTLVLAPKCYIQPSDGEFMNVNRSGASGSQIVSLSGS